MAIGMFSSYNHAGNTQAVSDVHPAFTAAKRNDHDGLYSHLLSHLKVMAVESFDNQNTFTPARNTI